MERVATTRMSSKGQVVIPEEVRNRLCLEPGTQFIVMGENDVVILKTITPPSMSEFDTVVARARRQAKAAGMKPSDITRACRCQGAGSSSRGDPPREMSYHAGA
jgi:AbrB family looped-hinge helix DNA binding protein